MAKKKGRKPYRGGNASKRELMLKFCGYNLDQAANRTAAIDELSTLLLAAMHDVCGFGAKSLVALYQAIADMSDCPDYGKLETELKQAGFDVRHELSADRARAAFFGTYKLGRAKKGLEAS